MIQQELLFSFYDRSFLAYTIKQTCRSKRLSQRKDLNSARLNTMPIMPKPCMAAPSVEDVASLPRLPAELRERIYQELLLDQPSSLFNLLTVNRCISTEVRPWILRQPITFDGQQSLFQWLSSADPHFLRYVGSVRLKLHDIDTEQMVASFEERMRRVILHGHSKGIDNPYHEACKWDIAQILIALRRFKNLRSFTALCCTHADPRPSPTITQEFLRLILEELPLVTLKTPNWTLFNTPARGNDVGQLQIEDYPLVDSPGFPSYLEAFPKLKALHLSTDFNRRIQDSRRKIRLISLPSESIPRLQDLTICLHNIDEWGSHEKFIHGALERHILALAQQPTTLLKSLRLRCTNWVGRTTSPLQSLIRFLRHSSLEHIDTTYWWTPFPNDYPASIVTATVRFESSYHAFPNWLQKFYDAVRSPRTKFFATHPDLKEVLLYLPPEARGELKGVATRQEAVTAICRDHGVRVRVVFSEGDCGCCRD